MQTLNASYRGLWVLVQLNADRMIYLGAIAFGLLAGEFLLAL